MMNKSANVVSFTDKNIMFNSAKKQTRKNKASLSQMSLTNYNQNEISVLGK